MALYGTVVVVGTMIQHETKGKLSHMGVEQKWTCTLLWGIRNIIWIHQNHGLPSLTGKRSYSIFQYMSTKKHQPSFNHHKMGIGCQLSTDQQYQPSSINYIPSQSSFINYLNHHVSTKTPSQPYSTITSQAYHKPKFLFYHNLGCQPP